MSTLDLETLAALAKQPTVVRIEPGNVLVLTNVGATFRDHEHAVDTLSQLKEACGASVIAVFEEGLDVETLESELARERDELIAQLAEVRRQLDEAEENQRELSKDWARTVREMQAEINELTGPATRGDQAAEFGDPSVVLGTEWVLTVSCPACGTPEQVWCFEATKGGHAPGNVHDERKERAREAQT